MPKCGLSAELLAQVVAKLLRATRMPQFSQCLGLDLADPFSGDPELAPYLFQRSLTSVVEPEAQRNDSTLTLGQRPEHVVDRVPQQRLRRFLDRRNRLGVLDQIP